MLDIEFSRVAGSTGAMIATQRRSNHFFQRPDADHLEVDSNATALGGYSMNAALSRQAGKHWRGQVGAALTSPAYEVNDLGFASAPIGKDVQSTLTYLQNTPDTSGGAGASRELDVPEHNYAWQPTCVSALSANADHGELLNLNLNVGRYFQARCDDHSRGEDPLATRPAWWQYNLNATSDGENPG
jgi:hypothetical protein